MSVSVILSCCASCVDVVAMTISALALVVAVITMVCNLKMLHSLTQNIAPEIKEMRLQRQLDVSLDNAKSRLIYPCYFQEEVSREPNTSEFKEAVRKTFEDILKVIPDLSDKGFEQEDWLLAEWLLNVKNCNLRTLTKKEIKEMAEAVHSVSKQFRKEV